MIAKIKGVIDSFFDGYVVIMTASGVGYRLFCSQKTLAKMPLKGEVIELYVETHVREDHIHLFGFYDKLEQDIFCHLISVQGVGAKVALAILSALTPSEIQTAVVAEDAKALTRASGVGGKMASRLITELKGKVEKNITYIPQNSSSVQDTSLMPQALSALENLGYSRSEAAQVIARLLQENVNIVLSDLIKSALKELAKHG